MGKPPGQSDFEYLSPELDHEQDMADNGASPRVTKAVYYVVAVLVIVLCVLVAVELHVPRGE